MYNNCFVDENVLKYVQYLVIMLKKVSFTDFGVKYKLDMVS